MSKFKSQNIEKTNSIMEENVLHYLNYKYINNTKQ